MIPLKNRALLFGVAQSAYRPGHRGSRQELELSCITWVS